MASEADILQARNLNKRTKLGPPDVYPQVKDQREDKLNDLSLKKVMIDQNMSTGGGGGGLVKPLGFPVHKSSITRTYLMLFSYDSYEISDNDDLFQGFSNPPVTQNECGSARERIKAKGLSTLQQSIQLSSEKLAAQKHNNNTVNDNGTRKIQTIQRDQFWSVNPR